MHPAQRLGSRLTPSTIALTTISGVAYALAFPPLSLRPLAWVALVPFLVAIRRSSLAGALALGAVWATVMTFATSDCLPRAVENYYQQPAWVGWLLLLGATVVTMVPYYAGFAASYWILARRFSGALPLLAACAWVGAELARVKVLGGNPWSLSGYSQIGVIPLMQVAAVAGVHGMSFVVAIANAALTEVWMQRRAPREARRRVKLGLAAAAAAVACVFAYGLERVRAFDPDRGFAAPVKIAILQGNLDLGRQWRRDMYGRNLDEYLRLTWEAAQACSARLVFWPESAMTFFLPDEPRFRAAIGRVLRPAGVQLVAGGPRIEETAGAAPLYFNSTFLLSSQGQLLAWQDKTKLLPFAEYFPFGAGDLVLRDFGRARQFSPGEERPPLASVAGAAGVVVCNEGMFPEPSRDRVAAGAEYLVNPANDSWFADLKYSLQAFDIVRLRAVEQGRYLVRASTAGPSAIVDPLGRVLAQSTPFKREWIAGWLRPGRETTVYHRVGDLFAGLCAAIAAVATGVALLRTTAGAGARP